MTIQVGFWDLVGLLLAFFGCVGVFGRLLLAQIDKRLDERFQNQEQARAEGSAALRASIEQYAVLAQKNANEVVRLEKDFLKYQAQMPEKFVLRTDHIRDQAVVEARLDALYGQVQLVHLQLERLTEKTKGLDHG